MPFADLFPSEDDGTPYLPLVRGGDVRALVPASPIAVSRRAVSRSNGPETLPRRLARRCYVALSEVDRIARPRAKARLLIRLSDTDLREGLTRLLGRETVPAYSFGPPRGNRKPVVMVYDVSGRLVAVAKVGAEAATAALVEDEARALARLGTLVPPSAPLITPRLLGRLTWRGMPVIVASALDVPGRHRSPAPAARHAAEQWIASLASSPDGLSSYVAGLERRLRDLPDSERGLRLARLAATSADRIGRPVATGSWHGDWSPQNLAAGRGQVLAWDWERFAAGRPHGFDAMHHRLQTLVVRRERRPGARLADEAAALLTPWQRLDDRGARSLSVLLLLELAARYGAAGARGGWIDGALTHHLEEADR